jgi:flagellar protein FliO/FliZ
MDSSILSSLFTMILATGFVLALAFGVLSIIRRTSLAKRFAGGDRSADMTFVRALAVGQRERLVVVRYKNEQLLLGVTAGGISVLRSDPVEPVPEVVSMELAPPEA